jgi:CubicO group peptidase (beta-lactamase class C family)
MSNPTYPATGLAEIDAACAAFAEQERIPGLALGIVQDGRLAHAVTVGLADREAGRHVGLPSASPR